MSQKVQILGVKHSGGSVYLGEDSNGNPQWTRDAHRIMDWLCDGWRYRFNQHRAHRPQRSLVHDKQTGKKLWVDMPLGGFDVPSMLTDRQARLAHSWLRAIPTDVLKSPKQIENAEWFSALKRKSKNGGRLPAFKTRGKSPQTFSCWRNGSQAGNAIFSKVGKCTGLVTIGGNTPSAYAKPGSGSRWKIKIRVRVSEEIRLYTSINVNWTAKTLVFTNSPEAIERQPTGSIVGIDRGVTHTLTTSNSEHIDIPKESKESRSKIVQLQRKLARQDRANEARGGKVAKYSSNRRKGTVAELKRLAGKEARRRQDWIQQTTTKLVRDHDFIALEDLRVSNMTRKGRGKRGLNRAILQQNWSGFLTVLQYKAKLAGVEVVLVNPAYTSQACSACGYTAKENRESQAIFRCVNCSYEANADVNAALNILERGLQESGRGNGLGHGGMIRPSATSVAGGTPSEVSTTALAGGLSGPLVQPEIS